MASPFIIDELGGRYSPVEALGLVKKRCEVFVSYLKSKNKKNTFFIELRLLNSKIMSMESSKKINIILASVSVILILFGILQTRRSNKFQQKAEYRATIEERPIIQYEAKVSVNYKNPENGNVYYFKISTNKPVKDVRFGLYADVKNVGETFITEFKLCDVLTPDEPYILSSIKRQELRGSFNNEIKRSCGLLIFMNQEILGLWVYIRYRSYNDPENRWNDYDEKHSRTHYVKIDYKE